MVMGTRGRGRSNNAAAPTPNPTPPLPARKDRVERPAGLDFDAITNPKGAESYQEATPGVDLFPIGPRARDGQQLFAYTINTLQRGLGVQRNEMAQAHGRVAQSTAITHNFPEMILPWEVQQQTNLKADFPQGTLLHARFRDRVVMAPYLGFTLYAETSISDPTVISVATLSANIYALANVRFAGVPYLAVLTNNGMFLISESEDNFGIDQTLAYFKVVTSVTGTPAGGLAALGHQDSGGGGGVHTITAVGSSGIRWATAASTEAYWPNAVIQSPAAGSPLLVRSSNVILAAETDDFAGEAKVMTANIGLGNCQAIGFWRVGTTRPAAYWLESNFNGIYSASNLVTRITKCDGLGLNYEILTISMNRILGAVPCADQYGVGGLALVDGRRVLFYAGKERELNLFRDEPRNDGYKEWCVGLAEKDNQLYAHVAELPYDVDALTASEGRVRVQLRKYSWEQGSWAPVSEWLTLTETGLINWATGIPFPVVSSERQYGYMPAYGSPNLPFGPVTRALHSHAIPARYLPDLSAAIPLPTAPPVTWFNKFQEHHSENPLTLRGSGRSFAESAVARTPGIMWPGELKYLPKLPIAVNIGGIPFGTAPRITARIGEYDPDGELAACLDQSPLEHTWVGVGTDDGNTRIAHEDRRYGFSANRTLLLCTQFEVEIERDESDEEQTPQALPITWEIIVFFPKRPPWSWRFWHRR